MEWTRLSLPPLGTNAYLLFPSPGHAAVVDPGSSPQRILDCCQEHGAQLKWILLTHGHFDHIGAVAALKEKTRAKVMISAPDSVLLENGNRQLTESFGLSPLKGVFPDEKLEDGASIQMDQLSVRVISTPGHTPGSVCYQCGELLFTGDTLFAGSAGRTDLPGGDQEQLFRSLQRLAQLPGDFQVLPGHEGETTLERERTRNPYMNLTGGAGLWY